MASKSDLSVQEQIKAQGEIVRKLKKDKAPEETVSEKSSQLSRKLSDCTTGRMLTQLP